jgi:hypothetical protein
MFPDIFGKNVAFMYSVLGCVSVKLYSTVNVKISGANNKGKAL